MNQYEVAKIHEKRNHYITELETLIGCFVTFNHLLDLYECSHHQWTKIFWEKVHSEAEIILIKKEHARLVNFVTVDFDVNKAIRKALRENAVAILSRIFTESLRPYRVDKLSVVVSVYRGPEELFGYSIPCETGESLKVDDLALMGNDGKMIYGLYLEVG